MRNYLRMSYTNITRFTEIWTDDFEYIIVQPGDRVELRTGMYCTFSGSYPGAHMFLLHTFNPVEAMRYQDFLAYFEINLEEDDDDSPAGTIT